MTNLFDISDLKTGIFNANGSYNQWKPNSRCIEIAVSGNTTYYFRYGDRSCNYVHVLLVSESGAVSIYGSYGVITTRPDTASLKITFAEDVIVDIGNLDYGRFVLSIEPFTDTFPLSVGLLLKGYYPTATGNLVPVNNAYRCFGFVCRPGSTYNVLHNGTPAAVYGLNQYDKAGNYIGRATSVSSITAADNAAVIGVVLETASFADPSLVTIQDGGGAIDPPEPEFSYGTPYYDGTPLKVGAPATGTVVLPYQNATAEESYSLTVALSGAAATGLATPVTAAGNYAASGTVVFRLAGTPTTAGSLTATITGTGITDPVSMQVTVSEAGTIDPPAETYHYVKVGCKPRATYRFQYSGTASTQAVFSYFAGSQFLRRQSDVSVITTPAGCDTLGINLPDSAYQDRTKAALIEVGDEEYKSLVQLTQDMAALKEGSGGSTPVEPEPTVPYYDINFYLFGDSITASNITRWVPTFMSLISFKHIGNFAVGGANYTCSANVVEDLSGLQQGSSNKIWNQFNRLKAKTIAGESPVPDVIVILAGINDRYSQLGDPEVAFDYTVDYSSIQVTDPLTHNLAGAFRFTLEAILNEWPDVRVIIATPLPVGASTREKLKADNETVEAITKTLTACARKMALPVINQAYECGISPYRELGGEYLHYNSDGLHPNQYGGQKIGKYLARRIPQILGLSDSMPGAYLEVSPTDIHLAAQDAVPSEVKVRSNADWTTQ